MAVLHLVEKDRAHLIHPVTPLRAHEQRGVTVLKSAQGCFLTDADGHTVLDGFAGLWCVNAGYGQESIIEAAAHQMRQLPYATGYFHFGSEPAIELAAKLAEIAPGNLNRVFFTLGGSDAVDTVIRIVRYYNNVRGLQQKKHFISLEHGYHGSSASGSGLTALPVFHGSFDVPHSWQHHIPSPYPYRNPFCGDPQAIIEASVRALKAKVAEVGADNVAAFICEPVQGSGGVIIPPEGFLTAMQTTCRELGLLFIVDEVITGFGRTGPMFACEHENITPDIMTVAKGLTSGYAPMGAVLVSDAVYEVLAEGTADGRPFGHGLTYSGHPVSAAVGLAAMRLYQDGGLIENGRKVGAYFGQRLQEFADHPLVGDVRSLGLLGAIELVADKKTKRKPARAARVAARLFEAGYKNGLIFRAFSDDIIGFAPPLSITQTEIDLLIERLSRTLTIALDFKDL